MVIISLPFASSHLSGNHSSSRAERGTWAAEGALVVVCAPPAPPGPSLTLGVTCEHEQRTSSNAANRFMKGILCGTERQRPHQHAEVARVGAEVLFDRVERLVDRQLQDVRRAAVGRLHLVN